MNTKQHKRHSNILKQIINLKSENRTLSSRRESLVNRLLIARISNDSSNLYTSSTYDVYKALRALEQLSERIGRNSLKIMQLRTKISQEKAQFEREELLLQEQWLMNDSQDMLDAQNEIFIDK